MKYYVDIVYIMIINGVIISKNKNILEKKLLKHQDYLMLKKHQDYLILKKQCLKSVKGSGLKILR